ncbi:PREDICTED: uncharacterized protein LOC105561935 [Vollenhovia emeryi]|uniref:uncharacterized protein LOC105561935 n=1 Tax=Vollenhovia emeryi TaxID=411798 RepID=UPI0005F3D30A|nr:PREDICTED: uncharacterized protein LOC105561935 [Vollenhovia emeryi]
MKPYIKLSTSRKSLHKLSVRQRRRVMTQARTKNLRLQISRACNFAHIQSNNSTLQDIPASSIVGSSSHRLHDSFSSNINILDDNIDDIRRCVNVEDDTASLSSTSSHGSHESSSLSTTSSEPSFSEHLASCFVDNNLTHSQGNSVLSVLKTLTCFSNLPKDVRTLLNTPRHRVVVCKVEPGEYIHFNLETGIVESVRT